jgi:dethiobiotin synthetase
MRRSTHQGIFVTGTDTGVGKTLVAAGLAALFRQKGLSVGVMKPVQTGCLTRRGVRTAPDARLLLRASGADDPIDQVCPYRFTLPAAPWVAAEHESARIDIGRIEESFKRLSSRHRVMIVEGAGGLLTPITSDTAMLELAGRLNLPLIIVATTRLGTLNHTLLTVRWAQHEGASVLGVIFNRPFRTAPTRVEKINPRTFSRLSSVPVLGTIPFLRELNGGKGRLDGVRRLGHHLNEGLDHLGIKLDP